MAQSRSRRRDWKRLLRLWRLGPATGTIAAMKYINAYPNDYGGWLVYADCKWTTARYDRARWALRRARRLAPASVQKRLQEQWGLYFEEKRDFRRAERSFRRALRAVPDTRRYVQLGIVLEKQGRLKPAENMYRRALHVRTKGQALDKAHFHLGLTLRARGRYREAAAHFSAALRVAPHHTLAQKAHRDVLTASVLRAKGLSRRRASAELHRLWRRDSPATLVRAATEFTRAYPRCYWGWMVLAHGMWALYRYGPALAALRRAQAVIPPRERSTLYVHRGWFFRDKGDLRRAEIWYRRAVRARSTTSHLIHLGACLARQGKLKEAERVHRRAIRVRTPGDPVDEAHLNLGLVLRARARLREAATHFKTALRMDPRYADAKDALRDVVRARAEHASYRVTRKDR